jgi:hypothetical protein
MDDLDQRMKDSSDGRDRTQLEVIDTYPKGDIDAARTPEQNAINGQGGVDNLDNRRNEIAVRNWPGFGVIPP